MNPGAVLRRIRLNPGDAEYKAIVKEFNPASLRAKVLGVEQVNNPKLERLYGAIKAEMVLELGQNNLNENIMWHGGSAARIENIVNYGYNRGFCRNNVDLGKGIYMAVASTLAGRIKYAKPSSTKQQQVLRNKVLVGLCGQGVKGMAEAPLTPNGNSRFSSVCDDVTNTTMVVLFQDNQSLPTHVVTFEKYEK